MQAELLFLRNDSTSSQIPWSMLSDNGEGGAGETGRDDTGREREEPNGDEGQEARETLSRARSLRVSAAFAPTLSEALARSHGCFSPSRGLSAGINRACSAALTGTTSP